MSKSIAEIKKEFEHAAESEWDALCGLYASDERRGVQNLIAGCRKKQAALDRERERLYAMKAYERKYEQYTYIWDRRGGKRSPCRSGRGGGSDPASWLRDPPSE